MKQQPPAAAAKPAAKPPAAAAKPPAAKPAAAAAKPPAKPAAAAAAAALVEQSCESNPGSYGDTVQLFFRETEPATKETKTRFDEAIIALTQNNELSVIRNKEYDFFITLKEHEHNVRAHHIHFYINNNRCVWHYAYHAREDKRQPDGAAYLYVYDPENFPTLLLRLLKYKFECEKIQTLRQKLEKAKARDPFAFSQEEKKFKKFKKGGGSKFSSKKSKKGQQKKSSRKKSSRKKSFRKKSFRKKSFRKKFF